MRFLPWWASTRVNNRLFWGFKTGRHEPSEELSGLLSTSSRRRCLATQIVVEHQGGSVAATATQHISIVKGSATRAKVREARSEHNFTQQKGSAEATESKIAVHNTSGQSDAKRRLFDARLSRRCHMQHRQVHQSHISSSVSLNASSQCLLLEHRQR